MSRQTLRVLVVDDSALYRKMLLNVLGRISGVEVVGVAEHGAEAVEMVATLRPDVLTLDVQMPELDGIGVLRALRERGVDCRTIMVSSLTQQGAPIATEAMLEGAFDVVAKPMDLAPHEAREFLHQQLVEKFEAVRASHQIAKGPASAPRGREAGRACGFDVVAIASSTGGPPVLREILSALPGEFPVPVLIVQHMPKAFTPHLAERLSKICGHSVVEATDDQLLTPGTVLLAPGGIHIEAVKGREGARVKFNHGPPENSCRPAADVLFRSAAQVFGDETLAVVLTGMGSDGLAGCKAIAAAGGAVIAQDEPTSIVWGMPGQVVRAGLAETVLPLDRIGPDIAMRIRRQQ